MKLTLGERKLIRHFGLAVKNFIAISRGYDHVECLNRKTNMKYLFRY